MFICKAKINKFENANKLKYNGIYNTLDTQILACGQRADKRYTTNSFAFFTRNNRVFREIGVNIDNSFRECEYFRKIQKENYGKYYIQGDSIFARLPTTIILRGMRYKTFVANFSGCIKNSDTIISWKLVPPYPVKFTKFVKEHNKTIIEPQILYFIENNSVDCVKEEN